MSAGKGTTERRSKIKTRATTRAGRTTEGAKKKVGHNGDRGGVAEWRQEVNINLMKQTARMRFALPRGGLHLMESHALLFLCVCRRGGQGEGGDEEGNRDINNGALAIVSDSVL